MSPPPDRITNGLEIPGAPTGMTGELFWVRCDLPLESVLASAARGTTTGYTKSADGIAIFTLSGVMLPSKYARSMEVATNVDALREAVQAATIDQDIKAALFVIDSPGGAVAGAYELASAIAKLSATKPTGAYIAELGASAAYLAASQAGRVTAYRTAVVGSIGTRMVLIDWHKMLERWGVEVVPIDSGGMKSAALTGTQITPEQREYFRGLMRQMTSVFVEFVATGRRVGRDVAGAWADGRVHVAAQAKSLGLIDAVGDMNDAVRELRGRMRTGGVPQSGGPSADDVLAEVDARAGQLVAEGKAPSHADALGMIFGRDRELQQRWVAARNDQARLRSEQMKHARLLRG